MRKITLEEMIFDSIHNGTKYRLDHFRTNEYIYWSKGINSHSFKDEQGQPVDLNDYSTYLREWREHDERN